MSFVRPAGRGKNKRNPVSRGLIAARSAPLATFVGPPGLGRGSRPFGPNRATNDLEEMWVTAGLGWGYYASVRHHLPGRDAGADVEDADVVGAGRPRSDGLRMTQP